MIRAVLASIALLLAACAGETPDDPDPSETPVTIELAVHGADGTDHRLARWTGAAEDTAAFREALVAAFGEVALSDMVATWSLELAIEAEGTVDGGPTDLVPGDALSLAAELAGAHHLVMQSGDDKADAIATPDRAPMGADGRTMLPVSSACSSIAQAASITRGLGFALGNDRGSPAAPPPGYRFKLIHEYDTGTAIVSLEGCAYAVGGEIYRLWMGEGGPWGWMGAPTTPPHRIAGAARLSSPSLHIQYFQWGAIVWANPNDYGAPRNGRVIDLRERRYDQVMQKHSHNTYDRNESIEEQWQRHAIRNFELDIHDDNALIGGDSIRGDWFVYHATGEDETLSGYLQRLRRLHDQDPFHDVITLWIELKDDWNGGEGHGPRDLDALLTRNDLLGPHLYRGSDLKRSCWRPGSKTESQMRAIGMYDTMMNPSGDPANVCNGKWPTLASLRGKFLIVVSDDESKVGQYLADTGGPEGWAVAFGAIAADNAADFVRTASSVLFFNTNTDEMTLAAPIYARAGVTRTWWVDNQRQLDGARSVFVHHVATNYIQHAPYSPDVVRTRPFEDFYEVDRNRPAQGRHVDLDGDHRADPTIFRFLEGRWWTLRSSDGVHASTAWGQAGDQFVPGDYDGDGKTDVAVLRQNAAARTGTWWFVGSKDGRMWDVTFGGYDVQAVPGDYDGDGKTDPAVWIASTGEWRIFRSSDGVTYVSDPFCWTPSGGRAVPADYDGDGKTDLACYSTLIGDWTIRRSSDGRTVSVRHKLAATGVPAPADYDGDGAADPAGYTTDKGWWTVRLGNGSTASFRWGGDPYDHPVPADFDGDDRADLAVWRASTGQWWIYLSRGGWKAPAWGQEADVPLVEAQ